MGTEDARSVRLCAGSVEDDFGIAHGLEGAGLPEVFLFADGDQFLDQSSCLLAWIGSSASRWSIARLAWPEESSIAAAMSRA